MPAPVVADLSSSMKLDSDSLARLIRFESRTVETALNVPPKSLVQRAMRVSRLVASISPIRYG